MSIFDVCHQDRAQRMIQQALASRRMPHSYLFAGPQGVGKEMLAERLGQLLLCPVPQRRPLSAIRPTAGGGEVGRDDDAGNGFPKEVADACGQCQDCRLVAAGTHPDYLLIHRQLNRQHPDPTIRKQKALQLSVEVIRHFLIERAGTYPRRGRAKVFIVREAERMNEAAQNSLLKTLEEPPTGTYIILLSSAADRLLPTTRSRCQQVAFQALPAEFIRERLPALRPAAGPPEVAYIARHAAGSLGDALRCLDDGLFALKCGWGERLLEMTEAKAASPPHELAKPFEADAKKLGALLGERDPDVSETDAVRGGLQTLLAVLAGFYLDALRQTEGADLPLINADQERVIGRLRDTRDRSGLLAALRHLAEADAHLGQNAHIELALETLFIRLARRRRK